MAEEGDDGERTQDPTQRHLDEALRRGDVVKSHEVNTWFMIAGATLILWAFSGSMSSDILVALRGLIGHSYEIPVDGPGFLAVLARLERSVLAALAIPFMLLVLAALGGNLVQHRLVWSGEGLKPKLSKISPLAGLKRLFSLQGLANFAKGLVKLGVIGAVMVAQLWPERARLDGLVQIDPTSMPFLIHAMSVKLLFTVAVILALVAAADYLFQYRQWYERQKMSVRDLKEEFRQTDGDPAVKGKIRQLRMARARKRMMAAVPNASVVITNPTHFAVALQYERGMNAPVCLAKGVDLIARRIREVAEQHEIPIVENPPLARALHATVEIDQEIQPEHYKAVAEIIGYVMRLNRRLTRSRAP
jgi:flagellar biosynthesis protein FlhB